MKPQSFAPDSSLVAHIAPSANFGERRGGVRPDMLILHYTGMQSCKAAIELLASPQSGVSCHYVVDEDGAITQMAMEAVRAWHAGVSHWQGVDDINSCSIGIEIHNRGHDDGYPDFPDAQMAAVEALCLDIVQRCAVVPHRILAHSDVAPGRKADPGEKFDWARLARAGIGHWVAPVSASTDPILEFGDAGDGVMSLQRKLSAYGYGVAALPVRPTVLTRRPAPGGAGRPPLPQGERVIPSVPSPLAGEGQDEGLSWGSRKTLLSGVFDERTRLVVAAFQRHFRPALVDGRADRSTVETLDALLAALG